MADVLSWIKYLAKVIAFAGLLGSLVSSAGMVGWSGLLGRLLCLVGRLGWLVSPFALVG